MKSSLKKALLVRKDPTWRGGAICTGCSLKQAKFIDQDIRDFFRAKKRGHPMPWSAFVRTYIHSEYKISIQAATLRSHARKCLKLEI